MTAESASSVPPVVPQEERGWKVVPVEPTEEMLSAMDDNHTDIGKWRDALAAAPKPQAAQSADMDRLTYRRSLGLPERFPQAVAEDAVVQALPGVHPMERMWREVGLPEYFLGNGGTNHKLYALYENIRRAALTKSTAQG